MSKTIFITGASRGFGRIWTEALLQRGHRVAATARNPDSLSDLAKKYGKQLLTISLDVNNRDAGFAAVQKAHEHFGALDVVINNAGYGLFGTIEETSEKEARDQIETNVFGLLWITQAAIPIMRAQGYGHIIQVSSVLGVVAPPVLGLYNASKWAVEAISESLATEVKSFGIHVTLVEPNGFSTDWSGASAVHASPIAAYEGVKQALFSSFTEEAIGKPEATAVAIVKLVDDPKPPLRLFLGKMALPWAQAVYADRLSTWEKWNDVAVAAHGAN